MSYLHALILGIIQGVTEFFPISSSAHLKLGKYFLGLQNTSDPFFELFCHLGTAFSTILFLRKEIFHILTKEKKHIFLFILALIPLVPIYFLFSSIIKAFFSYHFLGFFLLLSSFFLFISSIKRPKICISTDRKLKDVLFIGLMQASALLPGISRSGSTISAACFRGWQIKDAMIFSYLLAIPAIFGGSVIEMYKMTSSNKLNLSVDLFSYLIAFFTSFIVGAFCIRFIFRITSSKQLRFFAWYCFFLGLVAIVYFNQIGL